MRINIDTTNIMCFYTDISVVDVHYHSCYQIVVSTKSTYDSVIENKTYKSLKGFIIDKYTKHSCSAPKGSFLVYYIESKSFLGKQLKRILNKENFIDIETILSKKQLDNLKNDFSEENLTVSDIKRLSDNLLYDIFNSSVMPIATESTDSRILKAKVFIDIHLGENLTLERVANHIFLSPERTRHLFLEEIEIPFSQYVLWMRIKAVLTAVIQGKQTFFDASLQYGFTDQSHFNRFFKRMFGISATIILKNSRLVQFIYPEL
ncbi:MAG: AraC family transcriptional regulator [Bacteroidota bacterium]